MRFLIFISAILIFASCGNKFSLQKRKYNKGFYVHHSSSKENKSITAKVESKNNNHPAEITAAKTETSSLQTVVPEQKQEPVNTLALRAPEKNKSISKQDIPLYAKAPSSIKEENQAPKKSAFKPVILEKKSNGSRRSSFPFDMLGNSSGIYAVIGIFSALISFILLLFWLSALFSIFGGGGGIGIIGIIFVIGIIVVAAIIAAVILINSD